MPLPSSVHSLIVAAYGSVSSSRDVQPLNIILPIDVTSEGITSVVNDLQFWKAYRLKRVQVSGISKFLSFVHSAKAYSPILVMTPFLGIDVIAVL